MAKFYTINETDYFTTSGKRTEEFSYTTLSYTASKTVEDTNIVDTDYFSVQTNTTVENAVYETTSELNVNPSKYQLTESVKSSTWTSPNIGGPAASVTSISLYFTVPENVTLTRTKSNNLKWTGNKASMYTGRGNTVTYSNDDYLSHFFAKKSFYTTRGYGLEWTANEPYVESASLTGFVNGIYEVQVTGGKHNFIFNGYSYEDNGLVMTDVSTRNTTTSVQSESTSYRTSTQTDTYTLSGKMEPHYVLLSKEDAMTGYYLTTNNEMHDGIEISRDESIVFVGSSYTVDSASKVLTETYVTTTITDWAYYKVSEERTATLNFYQSATTTSNSINIISLSGGMGGTFTKTASISTRHLRFTTSLNYSLPQVSDSDYVTFNALAEATTSKKIAYGQATVIPIRGAVVGESTSYSATFAPYESAQTTILNSRYTLSFASSIDCFKKTQVAVENSTDAALTSIFSFVTNTNANLFATMRNLLSDKKIEGNAMQTILEVKGSNKFENVRLDGFEFAQTISNTAFNQPSPWPENGTYPFYKTYNAVYYTTAANTDNSPVSTTLTRTVSAIDYIHEGQLSTEAFLANKFYLAKSRDINIESLEVATRNDINLVFNKNSIYLTAPNTALLNGVQTSSTEGEFIDLRVITNGQNILLADKRKTLNVIEHNEEIDTIFGYHNRTYRFSYSYTYN